MRPVTGSWSSRLPGRGGKSVGSFRVARPGVRRTGLFLLALGACSGGGGSRGGGPAAVAPAPEAARAGEPGPARRCAGGVCLSQESLAAFSRARAALQGCVPAMEDYRGDASGLGLGGVARIEGADGATLLRVTLVNHGSRGVWTYPGTEVEVVSGDALLSLAGEQPATAASLPRFGIEACSAEDQDYLVTFRSDAAATVRVSAVTGFGDRVLDRHTVTVSR